MILHGNQRGGAKDLALHLMKDENERVEIHEMRGFVADTLEGAFQESYAISKATKCKQHLYSLSINPPADTELQPEHFVDAANQAEKRLGLDGQPRTIVFHEKHGADGILRRHAHAVWCRIDTETMTAKQLSFDREKLREVSRDLHIKHDLTMPEGLINSQNRSPRNFSLAEWQQCKRAEKDPKQVKGVFQDCWAISDSKEAFAHALAEQGYFLAQGRRGHVAVDFKGEKYPVSRYVGIKAKDVRARLGDADGLPSIDKAQELAAQQVSVRLQQLENEQQREIDVQREREAKEQERIKSQQALETARQQEEQQKRWQREEMERQERIRGGLWGLWDILTGKRREIERLNETEKIAAIKRDARDVEQCQTHQIQEREAHAKQASIERRPHEEARKELLSDIQSLAQVRAERTKNQSSTQFNQVASEISTAQLDEDKEQIRQANIEKFQQASIRQNRDLGFEPDLN